MQVDCGELLSGDVLGQDIVMPSGRTLMTTGMILTESMIELLKKRGFESILIQRVGVENNPLLDVVFDSDNLVNQTMKDFKQYISKRDDYFELVDCKGVK